jgi:hypothetical protein
MWQGFAHASASAQDRMMETSAFGRMGQRILVSDTKDGKKILPMKQFDAKCVSKYANIPLTERFCLYFCKKKPGNR